MKYTRLIKSKIVKKDGKYQVQSEKGRNLGTYDTKEEAKKRLKQVEYFKHKSKLITMDDLDKMLEDKYRKEEENMLKTVYENGFPSDEELKTEYQKYQYKSWDEDTTPMSFEDFKQSKIRDFYYELKKPEQTTEPELQKPDARDWFTFDDEWVTTDDDPIEEVKEVESLKYNRNRRNKHRYWSF